MDATTEKKSDIFRHDAQVAWEDVGGGISRKLLCYDQSIMLLRIRFEQGAVGAPHTHPHVQCSVVESGVFDVTIAEHDPEKWEPVFGKDHAPPKTRTARLTAGDSFIVPSGALHGAVCVEPGVLVDVFTPMRADFV